MANKITLNTRLASELIDEFYQCPDYRNRRQDEWHGIVTHHTGMPEYIMNDCNRWNRFSDNMAKWLTAKDEHYVSAHYQISIDTDSSKYKIIQLCCPYLYEAFHAGKSEHWNPVTRRVESDWNKLAIGVEILWDGNLKPYPEQLIVGAYMLTRDLMKAFPTIHPKGLVGHDEISPGRKQDPGRFFPWGHYLAMSLV